MIRGIIIPGLAFFDCPSSFWDFYLVYWDSSKILLGSPRKFSFLDPSSPPIAVVGSLWLCCPWQLLLWCWSLRAFNSIFKSSLRVSMIILGYRFCISPSYVPWLTLSMGMSAPIFEKEQCWFTLLISDTSFSTVCPLSDGPIKSDWEWSYIISSIYPVLLVGTFVWC